MKRSIWVIVAIFVAAIQLQANVIYSPGFSMTPAAANIKAPDVDCENVIDDTCSAGDGGLANVLGVQITAGASTGPFEPGWAPINILKISAKGALAIAGPYGWVANIPDGTEIGPDSQFVTAIGSLVDIESYPYIEWSDDRIWGDTGNDIFGTSFVSSDGTHYGWIGFDWMPLTTRLNRSNIYGMTASITGYAYEACPNAPIAAGSQSGGASCAGSDPPSDPTPEPASGVLMGIGFVLLMIGFRLFAAGKLART